MVEEDLKGSPSLPTKGGKRTKVVVQMRLEKLPRAYVTLAKHHT